MSEKYTPGPWKFERRNWRNEPEPHRLFVSGNEQDMFDDDDDDTVMPGPPVGRSATGVCIVEGNPTSSEVSLANARLIVAAPELLAALTDLADDIADRFDLDSPSMNPGIVKCVERARAAIAKASPLTWRPPGGNERNEDAMSEKKTKKPKRPVLFRCIGCGDPTTGAISDSTGIKYDCCPDCCWRVDELRKADGDRGRTKRERDRGPYQEQAAFPPCPECNSSATEQGRGSIECVECGHEWTPSGIYLEPSKGRAS